MRGSGLPNNPRNKMPFQRFIIFMFEEEIER
ncbi:hypothetical protein ES706_01997 [subsurface metagenome]